MTTKTITNYDANIKVYHGYGHMHNLVVYGHVLKGKPAQRGRLAHNIITNMIGLIRLFFVQPLAAVKVQLKWNDQHFETLTEADGFFKFEWESEASVPAGWHPVTVTLASESASPIKGEGKLFVPHKTQYAFISDIDDTVLVSHSASKFKRLRVLFTKNPHSRKAFEDVVQHYHLLSTANTEPDVPNPFFYVSSSEWNLYDDLNEFFKHNGLPKGVFLLNEIKKWHQLFETGKTKHHGKLIRVARIMDVFPIQRFVLFGDNSQSDPDIYAAIAQKYSQKIVAIYIRNIKNDHKEHTLQALGAIENKEIHTCVFEDNEEAIRHSRAIGLIV